jgi:hypothetical protein
VSSPETVGVKTSPQVCVSGDPKGEIKSVPVPLLMTVSAALAAPAMQNSATAAAGARKCGFHLLPSYFRSRSGTAGELMVPESRHADSRNEHC